MVDGGYTLPAGVADTLALISDDAAYTGFVAAVNANDPGAIQSAILEIVNDVNLIVPTTQAELVGAYALVDDLGRPGTVAVGLIQGARLELAADGTGTYVGALPTATGGVTWTYANGKATVTPVSPVTSVSYETIEGIGQVRRLYTERELQVTRLADGDGRDTLAVQQVVDYSYPDNPGLPGGTTTSAGTKLGIRDGAGRHAWTAAELVGQHSLPTAGTTYANSNNTGSEIHVIAADGTGFVGTSNLGFTWALADGVLQVAYADGSLSVFERVTVDGRGGEGVTARWQAPDGRRNAVFSLASVRAPGLFFNTTNGVGAWRSGFYISRTSNPAASDFYVIANAGGTGAQVVVEPWGTVPTALGWSIGLGALRWTYYRDGANQPVTFCEVGIDGCYIWQIRQWRPMARDGDRVYLIEEFLVDWTGGGTFEIVTQRANWYELAPPPPYRLSLPTAGRGGSKGVRR